MSIFDYKPLPPNIPMKTLGGKVFWDTIQEASGYRLQKHKVTLHYRIITSEDIRVAWSDDQGTILAKFYKLTNQITKPKRGDVIGVHRLGALYDHYGIYENDDCVYEYAAPTGDFSANQITIHKTTLKKFIGNSNGCFVLTFPEKYGKPGKVSLLAPSSAAVGTLFLSNWNTITISMISAINEFSKMKNYKLYSPDETIARAQGRLGESSYNLIFNNCEHYAIWCKTGIKESHQINKLLRI